MNTAVKVSQSQVKHAKSLCQPLFENTDIHYFSHVQYFHDGKAIALTTNEEMIEFIWENQIYIRHQDLVELPEYSIIYRDTSERDQNICDVVECDHMIRYLVKYKDYYEVNAFASNKPFKTMIDFYLNNIKLLKCFVTYFKDRAQESLDIVSASPFILNEFNKGFVTNAKQLPCTKEILGKFEAEQLIQQYKLSPREHECMTYLSEGKSTKEIAREINLSPNTVQFYINNLKRKVNCKKIAEIIKIYYQNN